MTRRPSVPRARADRPQSRSPSPAARPPVEFPADLDPLIPPTDFVGSLAEVGVELDPVELASLGRYLALLHAANERVNLTAIKDPTEAWTRHAFDALTLLAPLAEVTAEGDCPVRIIDVGSGGGLPGIPLAIVQPETRFTLLEATGKKCDFLRHAIAQLGLTNAEVLQARAEDAAHDRGVRTAAGREGGHRDAYDAVIARAVGPLPTLVELTLPFLRPGGLAMLIKGERADAELADAKQALHALHAAHAGTVPTPTGRIIVLEKLRATPKVYPRPSGEPKRRPLGVSQRDDA